MRGGQVILECKSCGRQAEEFSFGYEDDGTVTFFTKCACGENLRLVTSWEKLTFDLVRSRNSFFLRPEQTAAPS